MATRYAISMDQGATFSLTIDLVDGNGNDLDVSNLTAAAQMRQTYDSSNSYVFTTALANGSLVLSMTANQTGNIAYGRYVYDVLLDDNVGNVVRLIEGIVTVSPDVTRS
jgi:hypothetical protein